MQSDHRQGTGLEGQRVQTYKLVISNLNFDSKIAFVENYIERKGRPSSTPGSAINMASVEGLQKKFLDEVDGYSTSNQDGFEMPPQYYAEGNHNFDAEVKSLPVNMCTGRAQHLIFIESRLSRFSIRNRVRNYLLSEGGNLAPNFEIYFLIGTDPTVDDDARSELESEQSKFNDVIQISANEQNFSFATQVWGLFGEASKLLY